MNGEEALIHRRSIIGMIEAINSNPYGDRGNRGIPRLHELTEQGKLSEVCIKRMIRKSTPVLSSVLMYTETSET